MHLAPGAHLDDELLGAWAAGELPDGERTAALVHLEGCAECRAVLQALTPAEENGAQAFRPGDSLTTFAARYVPLRTAGHGAMGTVYVAYDAKLDRNVALKVLHAKGASPDEDGRRAARIVREAQALAQLAHPNIVGVYDVGSHRGETFLTMEYVEGRTLRAFLEEQAHGWREIVAKFAEAGRGLAAAHAANVVHRDFKPDNVLVSGNGRVRVADFGLANAVEHTHERPGLSPEALDLTLTETGGLVGTPAYLAPERFEGQPADALSDQFSFCVALYEALSGAPPFEGEDLASRREAVLRGVLRPSPRRVPARVLAVVRRGLSGKPLDRFPSMDALVAALEAVRVRRRAPLGVGIAVFAGLLLAVVGLEARVRQQRCSGGPAAFAQVWNDGARAALRRAFEATGLPSAEATFTLVSAQLDKDRAAWIHSHHEACAATQIRGEQSEAILDRRMQCLAQHLAAVRGLTESLTVPLAGDPLRHALGATYALPPVRDCDDLVALRQTLLPLASQGKNRAEVTAVREELGALSVPAALGKPRNVLGPLGALAKRAHALGDAALEAEVLEREGGAESAAGDVPGAETTLRQAFLRAAAGGDVWREAHARLALAAEYGLDHHVSAETHRLVDEADARIEYLGGPASLRGQRAATTALLARAEGKPDLAVKLNREALAILEPMVGEETWQLLPDLRSLGDALTYTGQIAAAEEVTRRSLAIAQRWYGPDSSLAAELMASLALEANDQGRPNDALVLFDRALKVDAANRETDTLGYSLALRNKAGTLVSLDRYAEAERTYEQAVALERDGGERQAYYLAGTLVNLADSEEQAGENERALAASAEAARIYGGLTPPHRGEQGLSLALQARAADELGQRTEALTLYEQAIPLVENTLGKENPNMASVLVMSGEALVRAGRVAPGLERSKRGYDIVLHHADDDPARVATLALLRADTLVLARDPKAARKLIEGIDVARFREDHGTVQKVQKWLAKHPEKSM